MAKIRVGQLAKELDLKVGQLLEKLRELGVEAKSNLSTVEDDVASRLRAGAPAANRPAADKAGSPPAVKPAVARKPAPKSASATQGGESHAASPATPVRAGAVAPRPAPPAPIKDGGAKPPVAPAART